MTFSATKDPQALLDYELDWAPYLDSDVIGSATWEVPAGLVSEAEANTTKTATIWLSGGTVGVRYSVVCRITTAGGRIDDRTITVLMINK